MLGAVLSAMVLINLGVFVMVAGLVFYNIDENFAQIIERIERESIGSNSGSSITDYSNNSSQAYSGGGNISKDVNGKIYIDLPVYYIIPYSQRELADMNAKGLSWQKVNQGLIKYTNKISPIKDENLVRKFVSNYQVDPLEKSTWQKLGQQIKSLDYQIYPEINGKGYLISYNLGAVAYQTYLAASLLLLLEIIFLLGRIFKGNRRIKRTLRPLTDLAIQTRELNQQIQAYDRSRWNRENFEKAIVSKLEDTFKFQTEDKQSEDEIIKNLQGELNAIDGSQLNKRISLDNSHKELQGLGQAINMMLNRIDESYQSQIRFVSDASHELRTPIAVIQGYANLLDRWAKDDPATRQEAIDAIKGEANHMKDLVEHLLFLARGDNDNIHLHIEEIDLTDLVREIIQESKLIGVEHEINYDLAEGLVIYADRQLIKQALRILLDNSIKYTPSDKQILIITEQGIGETIKGREATAGGLSAGVSISIQDQGIGISADDLPHVFDRFYRSDESRARETGGTGLGLAIVKWIVDRHQGEIEIFSLPDVGTRTTINL